MQSTIITNAFLSTPRLTRYMTLIICTITLLLHLGILNLYQLTYSRYYLFKFQFHRVFTSLFCFGHLSMEVFLHILFFYRYSSMLEGSCGRTSDYFYTILIASSLLFLISNIFYIPLIGTALSGTITYIWTRKNPQAIVQIMGFVSFYAFYLPFIVPTFTLIFEGRVGLDELLGIVVGHLVFYFKEVYPTFGRDFLATPCWCHRLFNELCDVCPFPDPIITTRPGEIQERIMKAICRKESDVLREKEQHTAEKAVPEVDDALEDEKADSKKMNLDNYDPKKTEKVVEDLSEEFDSEPISLKSLEEVASEESLSQDGDTEESNKDADDNYTWDSE